MARKIPGIKRYDGYFYRSHREVTPMCDNPSGEHCRACRGVAKEMKVGGFHCSDPENCNGMEPMRHWKGCGHSTTYKARSA